MFISVVDFRLALVVFGAACTATCALQSEASVAHVAAEARQTQQPHELGGQQVGNVAANLPKTRNPKISAFFQVFRSHQRWLAKYRASREPGDTNVMSASAETYPSDAERTAQTIHIFCLCTFALAVVFTVATCCARTDGPHTAHLGRTGSADGRSCFLFPDNGMKPMSSQAIARSNSASAKPMQSCFPAVQLLVDLHALKTGTWPLMITELDGKEAFRVVMVDTTQCLSSTAKSFRRSGSSSDRVGSQARLKKSTSNVTASINQAIQIFTPDGWPVAVVTPKFEIYNCTTKASAKLVATGPCQFVLQSVGEYLPDVIIERLHSGVLVVRERGTHAPLVTAAPVWYMRESIEIAYDGNLVAQPMVKMWLLSSLLGMIIFLGDLRT